MSELKASCGGRKREGRVHPLGAVVSVDINQVRFVYDTYRDTSTRRMIAKNKTKIARVGLQNEVLVGKLVGEAGAGPAAAGRSSPL